MEAVNFLLKIYCTPHKHCRQKITIIKKDNKMRKTYSRSNRLCERFYNLIYVCLMYINVNCCKVIHDHSMLNCYYSACKTNGFNFIFYCHEEDVNGQ